MQQICAEQRGSSAQADTIFPRIRVENGGKQKANFVRNNAEGSRKTPQGSFKLSLQDQIAFPRRVRLQNEGEIREGIILAISVNTKRRNKSVRLRITSAEFCTEFTNCPCRHTQTAARLYADYPCSSLRQKLSFPCHVPYEHALTCWHDNGRLIHNKPVEGAWIIVRDGEFISWLVTWTHHIACCG